MRPFNAPGLAETVARILNWLITYCSAAHWEEVLVRTIRSAGFFMRTAPAGMGIVIDLGMASTESWRLGHHAVSL
jgi:hypothetical protein